MGKKAGAVDIAYKTAASHLVRPDSDAKGVKQPDYVRGGISHQTSSRLKFHQACVGGKMAGKKFGGRDEVKTALSAAAVACKAENPHAKK